MSSQVGNDAAASKRKADAEWYNQFYQTKQEGLAPWYRFLVPELMERLTDQSRLIELGCGQAHVLRLLTKLGKLKPENITGVDQSQAAVDFCRAQLPGATFQTGDLYDLKEIRDAQFDVCLLMETIEHLENPEAPLKNIWRILKPGGVLFVSFPNYLHLPWLVVRVLSEKLNRPSWVVLQPVDKIYTVFGIIKIFKQAGFNFVRGVGSNYGPPVLYPLETDGLTRLLNSVGLWRFSFHPILAFQKPAV